MSEKHIELSISLKKGNINDYLVDAKNNRIAIIEKKKCFTFICTFICLAANNHEKLVDALEKIREHEEDLHRVGIGHDKYVHDKAKSVLAEIEKES